MLWRNSHPALHAIALVVAGYSVFVFTDTIIKWLVQDFNIHQILAIGSFLPLVITALWVISQKGWRGFITPKLKWHLCRGILGAGTSILVIKALSLIPLADFYGIVFLSPLVVLMLSSIFLKEPIGWHRFLAIIAGFIGVVILAGPQFGHMNEGIMLTFIAMIAFSIGIILIRKTGHDYMPLYSFYPSLFIFIVNAPMAVAEFEMPDITAGLVFLIYGPLVLLGQILNAVGYVRAPETAIVAPFHYTQMLWGVLFGYILFHDVPSPATIAGSVIIISSGLFVIWREHKLHIARQIPEMQK